MKKGDGMDTGIGQDSHKFDFRNKVKKLKLGGVVFEGYPPLKGNSDADPVLHAITNAISGITGINILGAISDKLCLEQNITDSSEYLKEALKYLNGMKLARISISIECLKPAITPMIPQMRLRIAEIAGLMEKSIGITATSGEGLTAFGKGKGIQVFAVVTAE